MKILDIMRRLELNSDTTALSLQRVVAGLDNQSDLLNQKFEQVIAGLSNQSALLSRELGRAIDGSARHNRSADGVVQVPGAKQSPLANASEPTLREAMQHMPLLIAERTYNTSHPEYDAGVVRNFPGRIFNK